MRLNICLTSFLMSAVCLSAQVNVASHGAKCDGVTDDTTAFLASISAAATVNGDVFVPASPAGCNVTRQLTIPRNIRLTGDGESSSRINCTNPTLAVCIAIGSIVPGSPSDNAIRGSGIYDIDIRGPYPIGGPWGKAIGIWIGGDPAGLVLPSGAQGNFLQFHSVMVERFGVGYQFGNNAYIIDWIATHTMDNGTGFYASCCNIQNSGEHLNIVGGVISGGTAGILSVGGGSALANPWGQQFDFYLTGVSLDYVTGPLITGSRITAHISNSHLESTYSPLIYMHETASGSGRCRLSISGSDMFVMTATGAGSDAPIYVDCTFANLTISDGNTMWIGRHHKYIVDWQVPWWQGTTSSINVTIPWEMDTILGSAVPAITNADAAKWGQRRQFP